LDERAARRRHRPGRRRLLPGGHHAITHHQDTKKKTTETQRTQMLKTRIPLRALRVPVVLPLLVSPRVLRAFVVTLPPPTAGACSGRSSTLCCGAVSASVRSAAVPGGIGVGRETHIMASTQQRGEPKPSADPCASLGWPDRIRRANSPPISREGGQGVPDLGAARGIAGLAFLL